MGVDGERVGLLDAGQQPAALAVRMAGAPKAPSTWNHSPSARHSAARSASGSTLPVLVVPEVATTQNGRRPAARSAATASATTPGGSRNSWSLPSSRTWDGRRPTSPAARPIQEWVWSEAYSTAPSSRSPSTARLAATSPYRLAEEPPSTNSPPAVSGRPNSSRSQRRVASSAAAAPEAACQVPANTPKPETRASASMPT